MVTTEPNITIGKGLRSMQVSRVIHRMDVNRSAITTKSDLVALLAQTDLGSYPQVIHKRRTE